MFAVPQHAAMPKHGDAQGVSPSGLFRRAAPDGQGRGRPRGSNQHDVVQEMKPQGRLNLGKTAGILPPMQRMSVVDR
jgi:hypothetical protein